MNAVVPNTNHVNDEKEPRKRPYTAPVLTKYGDIASLTRGAGNQVTDGGAISTA
jgi:hypothetical protein